MEVGGSEGRVLPPVPAPDFNMEDAEAEFVVAQVGQMAEKQAMLKSIHDEAYAKANQQFIRQKRAALTHSSTRATRRSRRSRS